MPTDDDKASAWLLSDGEAKRLLIRRPRLSRDGLYLFGRRFRAQTVTLSAVELAALFEGRTLAVDVTGEYIVYLRVDTSALDAVGLLGAMAGVPQRTRPAGPGTPPIPQREDSGAQPTFEQRVLAARVRVRIDKQQRRPRVKTPEWIMKLAKSDIRR
jgi:hypothetical protein